MFRGLKCIYLTAEAEEFLDKYCADRWEYVCLYDLVLLD